MLGFLFRRLTASPDSGAELFDSITRHARFPHWYSEGKVPDTLDGRFAVLATLTALTLARLEQAGAAANPLSVALTERFIEVLESEHRELGLGDPTLGKTMRRLVGSLSRRTGLWRDAVAGEREWAQTTRDSLYKGTADAGALRHSAAALKRWWTSLQRSPLDQIGHGELQ